MRPKIGFRYAQLHSFWRLHTLAESMCFQELGRLLFRGHLKGPFDEASRAAAGLTPDWYMPLVASEPAEPVQPHK